MNELNLFQYLNFGLGNLPVLSKEKTRSISAENPNGEKGKGALEIPDKNNPASDLGKTWKVRPCITLGKNTTTTLADIKGPGIIRHIWITVDTKAYRDTILRFYWDNEQKPSVEVPLGDFFANGHGLRYNVNSIAVAVNPSGGFNCYWPMPFKKRALITIENQRWEDIGGFFYQITYSLVDSLYDSIGYFHSQYRRSITQKTKPEHTILENVKGQGHYVGTFLAWTQLSNGWWGEGEIKFFIDGDTEYPTICTTGTEDYFCGAWCFGETFTGIYSGYPLWRKEQGEVPKHGLYRWHIMDPIRFEKDLKVTVQALGWWPNGKFQPLTDDIASVGYWYQTEPHMDFPDFPKISERWSR